MLNFFKRATKEIGQWARSHSKSLVLAGTIGAIGLGGVGCRASAGFYDAYDRGYNAPPPPVVVYEETVVAPRGYYYPPPPPVSNYGYRGYSSREAYEAAIRDRNNRANARAVQRTMENIVRSQQRQPYHPPAPPPGHGHRPHRGHGYY